MFPNSANIFKGKIEKKASLFWSYTKKLATYYRYIDDIFIIWDDTEDTFLSFLRYVNGCSRTIIFTRNYSVNAMSFFIFFILILKYWEIIQ